MDPFPHHRRLIGPPIAGDPPPPPPLHQQQHSSFWYPSSSPPPPPPPPGGYHHQQHPSLSPAPHQQSYSHHQPPPYFPPPQQQWDHPGDNHHHYPHLLHHQQQHQPPPIPTLPPAPAYHNHQSVPPYPGFDPSSPSSHPYPLPPRPQHTPQPAYPPPPPPHPSAYPPPTQGWGNSSWAQHEGWEYSERRIPYNNEEDWAARARAWAASKSATDNHYTQSQFISVGRTDDHSYPYRDQYHQQATVPPPNLQQPPLPQLSNQQLPELQKQDPSHRPAPVRSGSPYHTDGPPYYSAGGEANVSNAAHMASPQKAYGPSSSVYEQEVPYNYYSAPGSREPVNSSECSRFPLSLSAPSVQEVLNSHSTLPVRNMSMEQPHFSLGQQSAEPLTDASDLPLEFEPRSVSGHEPHQKISYGNVDPSGSMGVIDPDRVAMSVHSWDPGAASGVAFSQISSAPSETQFDTSFASQPPLSLHSVPAFGLPGSHFGPAILPVSVPFGLGTGTSVHHTSPFAGDVNGPFNFSERPKKAAVPNWLREEIIKQKSVMTNAAQAEPTGNSFHLNGPENADKAFRTANQADSKSIDSTKSTEDDEDDEDDLELARSAAINQEIKRVLTEVLLKVTDELFDEIAMKVLNEDDLPVEINESAANGTRKVSPPPVVPTPKASAKVLVQVKKNNSKGGGVSENSSLSSPGGNILGLANYASDEDETESSTLISSGMIVDASHQLEVNDSSTKKVLMEADKMNALLNSKEPNRGPRDMENDMRMSVEESPQQSAPRNKEGIYIAGNVSQSAEKALKEVSKSREEVISISRGKDNEVSTESTNPLKLKEARRESRNGTVNNAKSITGDGSSTSFKNIIGSSGKSEKKSNDKDLVEEAKSGHDKASHKTSDGDNLIHEGKTGLKKRVDRKDDANERFYNKDVRRGANERESDTRNSFKHDKIKDGKEILKDKREKYKESDERKREQTRNGKEDRSTRVTKDSSRHSSRRSSSPSRRGRKSKENSSRDRGSASSEESSENSKKRKLQTNRSSLSPSPTRTRKRQVSRSPHSKHSHRRHSPYSSLERRRMSRS